MVGDISLLEVERPDREYRETRLVAESLTVQMDRSVGLENISFQVRGGEVVGQGHSGNSLP